MNDKPSCVIPLLLASVLVLCILAIFAFFLAPRAVLEGWRQVLIPIAGSILMFLIFVAFQRRK